MNRKEKTKNIKKSLIEVNCPQGYLLPNALESLDFARSRVNEMNLLSKELEQAKYSSTRRTFQQLSRHMRRRASSYNIKRLPTRLRLRALAEIKNDPPTGKNSKNMKNCRRWRRRPSNLKSEFKAKNGWLETHMWHSKRCKMIDYWGFKIAAHLNEKCLKSTYRATLSGALLHDISYWQPFWMDNVDMNKLYSAFGNRQVFEIVLEHNNVELCPIKIFTTAFTRPILYLHPASLKSNILDHDSFKEFIDRFGIMYSSASESLCTFKLHGPKVENVLKSFLNVTEIPCRFEISDPRIGNIECRTITGSIDDLFLKFENLVSDDEINLNKSQLFLTDCLQMNAPLIPIVIIKSGLEYFFICPRSAARILWNNLIKFKPIKVAGVEQIDFISFENEIPVYPKDFVGSPAFEMWSNLEKLRLETIYLRKPPAKRANFSKFGIMSPFQIPIQNLKFPLIKSVVQIEGKGVITPSAEVYSESKILIGHVTSSSKSSLKKGCSTGIASISANFACSENNNMSAKSGYITDEKSKRQIPDYINPKIMNHRPFNFNSTSNTASMEGLGSSTSAVRNKRGDWLSTGKSGMIFKVVTFIIATLLVTFAVIAIIPVLRSSKVSKNQFALASKTHNATVDQSEMNDILQSYGYNSGLEKDGLSTCVLKPESREILGSSTWTFLHVLASTYPPNPSPEVLQDHKVFFQLLPRIYPCPDCRIHMRQMFHELPPRLESRSAFINWLCEAHNRVNVRLGKPVFDCKTHDERWDCGCNIVPGQTLTGNSEAPNTSAKPSIPNVHPPSSSKKEPESHKERHSRHSQTTKPEKKERDSHKHVIHESRKREKLDKSHINKIMSLQHEAKKSKSE